MPFTLGFSTSWNHSRHRNGEEILEEILNLGFDGVELGHGLSVAKVSDLRKAYKKSPFLCLGVHNFFPAPMNILIDNPDCYEFSSLSYLHRLKAIRHTLETIDTASEFNAEYVVLHLGSAPMHSHYTRKLNELLLKGKGESSSYEKNRQKIIKKRESRVKWVLKYVIEALNLIEKHASKQKIKIGIEVRSHLEQIPNEAEMIYILNQFKDSKWIGYWHDFGHCQRRHNLKLLKHQQWLSSLSKDILGGHFQDILFPNKDHLAPFSGDLNYSELLAHFPKKAPLVWELSPRVKRKEILEAKKLWKAFEEKMTSANIKSN